MTRAFSNPIRPPQAQHVILHDVSWQSYEGLLKDMANRPVRMTYDSGVLEIMFPLPAHERPKRLIGRMIETLSLARALPLCSFGSSTYRRQDKLKGLEPDECYYIKHAAKMLSRKRWNPKKDPPPDLVLEIDITSRSVDREPVYAALGVPEIWRYDGKKLSCLHLLGQTYRIRKQSLAFPFLAPADLARFVNQLSQKDDNTLALEFAAWVRQNHWQLTTDN